MIFKELKPKQALNKAFFKIKPNRDEIEGFKTNLIQLLDRINDTESEEFHKNLVSDFLKKTYSTHPKSCNSVDCIYFKINKFNKEKKLNRELGEFIGIMEPLKKEEEKHKCYSFKNKKRNVKINFKLSNITI